MAETVRVPQRVAGREAPGASSRATLVRAIWQARGIYPFIAPTFLLLFVFRYYPAFLALGESLFEWDGYKINIFVGPHNYQEIFADPFFWLSVRNVLIIVVFYSTLYVLMPMIVAVGVFNLASQRAQYSLRIIFLIPAIVPGIVHLLLWQYIYQPTDGLLNTVLADVGLSALQQTWLGDPKLALLAVLFVNFPWVSGVWVLIFLAGLENIPPSVVEAATIDGASRLRRIFAIDIPLISGVIKLFLILGIITGVQTFYNILILTNGGPAFATMVPGLYLYQAAFTMTRMGYASAVGVLMFIAILGITYLNWRFLRSGTEYDGN